MKGYKTGLFLIGILQMTSCLFMGKGDIHPEYPSIENLEDTVGFPLQELVIYKKGEIVDVEFLHKVNLKESFYYVTPIRYKVIDYYNKKGEFQFSFDCDKVKKQNVFSEERVRGVTKEGRYVFYGPGTEKLFLYDPRSYRPDDTIQLIFYSDLLYATYPDFVGDGPVHSGEHVREMIQRYDLPIPEFIPFPDETLYPNDSIGQARYEHDYQQASMQRTSIRTEYAIRFAESDTSDMYITYLSALKGSHTVVVDMNRKLALSLETIYSSKEIEKLPALTSEYIKADDSAPGNLFEMELEERVLHSVSSGTGRGGLWKSQRMYYYSLIFQQTDTIHFKSYHSLKIDDYTKVKDKYVLILYYYWDNKRCFFFEYTPAK
ncbi:MAG: hypothetical protein LUG98_13410 [Tannerellaceae bacterium]|nr:hypothetical protein [Tannerellaceae bacterium]